MKKNITSMLFAFTIASSAVCAHEGLSGAGQVEADNTPSLTVTSSAFLAGGELPAEFTGDGLGESPPISWSDGPPGTQCYALNLWHTPGPGGVKSYWLLYDIPSDVTSLPRNVSGIGTLGYNDKDRMEYDPMRSKGPGVKDYHITVYALSEKPSWSSGKVTREELQQAISGITLAEGTLSFQYTRSGSSLWLIIAGLVLAVVAIALWFGVKKRAVG